MLRVRAASRKLYFIIHPRISYLSSRYMINDCHTKRRRVTYARALIPVLVYKWNDSGDPRRRTAFKTGRDASGENAPLCRRELANARWPRGRVQSREARTERDRNDKTQPEGTSITAGGRRGTTPLKLAHSHRRLPRPFRPRFFTAGVPLYARKRLATVTHSPP